MNMARKSTRSGDDLWMKNVLVDWFNSNEYPYRKATVQYTDDNYAHFKECFVKTRAIKWDGKTKNYNADLVADLNGDQYLVDLKKWLDSGEATNVTDVTPRKPTPPRVAAVPARAAVSADGGKAVEFGSIPPPPPTIKYAAPPAPTYDFVPRSAYNELERRRSLLHAEREVRAAELQTTQEQLEEARRALQLANEREAQRARFAAETQRKAEEQSAAAKEAQRKAAEEAKMNEERASIMARKSELEKQIAEFNAKQRAQPTATSTQVSTLGKRGPETNNAAPPPSSKIAKSENDPATLMGVFGMTVGAVVLGAAITPMIPATIASAALALVVKAKLDAAKKQ